VPVRAAYNDVRITFAARALPTPEHLTRIFGVGKIVHISSRAPPVSGLICPYRRVHCPSIPDKVVQTHAVARNIITVGGVVVVVIPFSSRFVTRRPNARQQVRIRASRVDSFSKSPSHSSSRTRVTTYRVLPSDPLTGAMLLPLQSRSSANKPNVG